MGNLLVSPYLKRRIRTRAIRDYQIGEYQNSPYPFNVAPTSPQHHSMNKIEDYGLKAVTLAGKCQEVFMAAIYALHASKPVVEIAAIEIAVNNLLKIRSPESVLSFDFN